MAVCGIVFLCRQNPLEGVSYYEKEGNPETTQKEIPARQNLSNADQTGETGIQSARIGQIGVFVCGEVQEEGVYFLEDGARVSEAISAAGGFSKDADTDYWNLAAFLYDGERIYVPDKNSTDTASFQESLENDGKVNINTADAAALMQLPGIGAKRAEDIVQYRNKIGRFSKTEQLMEISGIKESLYQEIKDYIVIQ